MNIHSLLCRHDVFTLQETWLNDVDICNIRFPGYSCYSCEAKKSKCGGRNMGGVIVFIKNELCCKVKRICSYFKYGVLLNLEGSVFGVNSYVIHVLCSICLPPETSPMLDDESQSVFQILEDTLIKEELIEKSLIICGDLNARIGSQTELLTLGSNVPELNEFFDIFDNDIDLPRKSRDNKVNRCGKELLNFCKSFVCFICNSRFGDDRVVGDYTFVNQTGCSTIDYFFTF